MVVHQEITVFEKVGLPEGCTQEQYQLLVDIVFRVAREYSAQTGVAEICRAYNQCYIAEVFNKPPGAITEMNFSLAEAVCDEPGLDGCELIARFSSPAGKHPEGCYVDNQL
ncbi:hypothetical protein HQN64_19270 [Enterobacteriaceae bacterium BIT-l23]|uniref:hypothetical protein n=1 Tax=Jejubacter sp. L23 TaxID=3092086 RepID=UPI001584C9BC|nr:hypothetical protein [Enterobacteriaceae bacterium BIT-l23]